jgi:UDP-glucuronate 4-epimerase
MKILVTGAAGFIGFHTVKRLLERGDDVIGFDNLNNYYEPALKEARVKMINKLTTHLNCSFSLIRANLADKNEVDDCFQKHQFDRIIHLAAQAGVRYSLDNPQAYVESNLIAFTNVLEACRYNNIPHLTYASTSSVYGANTKMPFNESDGANHPLQFYAATKRANELMAHSYSHLFNLPSTGLRFFTVYGPWGRPDMALFKFTKNILNDLPIEVFNSGKHTRDFTYIDDIVEGIVRANDQIAKPDSDWDSQNPNPASSNAPFRILNIGNSKPVELNLYIEAIERALGKKAIKNMLPLQLGDVPDTYANCKRLEDLIGYKPVTSVEEGVSNFVTWYKNYYE